MKQGTEVMTGGADTYHGYGRGWANVSNTPFREYKHWVHEGGISTPLVAHWPKGIDRKLHGKFTHQPAHLIDLMATCVDLAKADYPQVVKGKKIVPMQGVSLKPAFSGKQFKRENPIFWEHEGNRAIRIGKWKLVAKGKLMCYYGSGNSDQRNCLHHEWFHKSGQIPAALANYAGMIPVEFWGSHATYLRDKLNILPGLTLLR